MKRKLLIALLAFGTVAGYTAGFAGLRCRMREHRKHMVSELTHMCAEAAMNANPGKR